MLLVSPIPSLVLPVSVAQAEAPVFVGGLPDLLPGEPSIADGSTQATYYFVLGCQMVLQWKVSVVIGVGSCENAKI